MLEGLVAWVLNNYLGKYVENLNTDQLSVALLSGKVELENLPLKKDALRHLGLPVEVKAGFIGKVQLQVPVRQIRSAPWLIAIEKLYLVAAPINLDEWDSDVEANIAHERKVALLDALEAQWRAEHEATDAGYYATSYSSWLSYGTGLLANIVENLQLKLNDVHIRYEDALTCAPGSFACGLTMESLAAESCDSGWRRGFTLLADTDHCSFKLLELQKLAIYWDPMTVPGEMLANCTISELTERMSQTWKASHRYLVAPASATARVRRERSAQPLRSRARPRLTALLTLHTVTLNLTARQYGWAVCCAQGLEQVARQREFRALRPPGPVRAAPRLWWVYALKCHYPHCQWTEPRPTWESCLAQARATRQYVEACLFVLSNPAATLPAPAQRAKDEFEWTTDLHTLKALRQIAMRKVPKATPVSTPDKPASSGRSMLVHWFPQWWGWYGAEATTPDLGDSAPSAAAPPPDLEEEILDVIADSLENNTLLKRDTVFGKFEFELTKGCLNLCTETEEDEAKNTALGAAGGGEGECMSGAGVELQFSSVRVRVESRPRAASHSLHVSLGSVCLRERITPDTLFPVLVAPQGMIREGLSAMNAAAAAMSWCRAQTAAPSAPQEPLFQLSYEKKPFGLNCDYKLWVKSASLEVVYCSAAVRWAQQFVCAPWGSARPRQTYAHVRDQTKQRLITQWEHMMHPHPGERRSWHVELDISAPQILFVEELCDKDASVLVVDFGRLRLGNALAGEEGVGAAGAGAGAGTVEGESESEEMFMTPCSTPPGSLLSPAEPPGLPPPPPHTLDSANLHNRLYDRYKIELSDLQILVGRARDNWKYAHTKTTSSLHLLDRFSISLQAERRVVHTSDPMYPTATLCGSLPALVVHLSEQKLFAVRSVIANSPLFGNSAKPDTQTQQTPEQEEDESSVSSETERSEHSSHQHATLFMLQFAIEQMSLEVQSRGRSIAEVQVCGVKAAATARPCDLSLSLSVHSLLLVDALQTYGPDFELLVASHKHVGMDTASGSIRGSEPTSPCSPTSPASPAAAASPPALPPAHALHHALYELHYRDYNTHHPDPGHTSPTSSWTTGSSWNTTNTAPIFNWGNSTTGGTAWGNTGTVWGTAGTTWGTGGTGACGASGPGWGAAGMVDSEALIAVELCLVKGEGDCEDLRIANILFNNLDIIANQETIVELIGFTQRVLGTQSKKVPSDGEASAPATSASLLNIAPVEDDVKTEVRTEITFDFHRLGVLLLRAAVLDGAVVAKKIATATLSEAKIQATVDAVRVSVGGSLGGVQVVSLCDGAGLHTRVLSAGSHAQAHAHAHENVPGPGSGHHPLDDKALLFNITRTVHTTDDCDTPVVEAQVSMHVASVWYTHSGPLLRELQSCLTEFKQYLANLARSIRAAAADMAIGLVHPRGDSLYVNPKLSQSTEGVSPRRRTTSVGYSIDDPPDLKSDNIVLSVSMELESPVVVVPRAANSAQVFVAHLGRMSLSNRPGPPHHTLYKVRVRDISLASLDVGEKLKTQQLSSENMQQIYDVTRGKPVLHNTALQLQINCAGDLEQGDLAGLCEVSGAIVGGLHVSARREQYEQLLDTLHGLAAGAGAAAAPAHPPDRILTTHTEAPALSEPAVPTLRLDPALRAAVLAVPPPPRAALSHNAHTTPLKVLFELATFTLELRADLGAGERSLVQLAFREFTVHYERLHRHETSLQVSLHSVTMEDLTKDPESKHRLMMMSHTPQVPPKAVFVSKSCPDFVTEYPFDDQSSVSSLHYMKSNSYSLPSQLNVADREIKRNHRDSKCGITPPCSPETGGRGGGAAEGEGEGEGEGEELSADDNLVWVCVHMRDPSHPLFEEKYNKISKQTKIDFNCLNLVVSIDSWVAVLDFFGVAGDDQPDGSGDPEPQQAASHASQSEAGAGGASALSVSRSSTQTQTETWIRSLSVVVVGPRGETCRALVSRVRVVSRADLAARTRHVSGRLGALLLADLTPHAPLWRDRFRTHADQALTFQYHRLSIAESQTAGHETSLSIEMGPVTYVHTKRFVQELQAFVRDFSLLRRVITQARLKVSVGVGDGTGPSRAHKMKLRVRSAAPVIVLPVSGRCRGALAAELSLLHIDNCFKLAGDEGTASTRTDSTSTTREQLDVRYVKLEGLSLWCVRGGRGLRVRRVGPPLLPAPTHLTLQIEHNMSETHNVPDMTIQGTLTTLQCALDPSQYRLVRGVLAHNLGECVDDLLPPAAEPEPEPRALPHIDTVWTTTSLKLDLHDVTVKLEPEHGVSSLACINFIKSRLLVETYSDLGQDIDLVSQEILVSDTRYASEPANRRGNVFSHIVQPLPEHRHSVQAEVHARKRYESSAYTILVNNMRLMAILDWWEAANQFIMQPPPPAADPDQPPLEEIFTSLHGASRHAAAGHRAGPGWGRGRGPAQGEEGQMELKLNVTDSQLVLVEDASVWDTNAVILKSTTVITYRCADAAKPVSCELNELEVFSCVLGLEEETALSIVEPAALHVALHADKVLRIGMSTFNLRLSYHDMRMFAAMLQSLPVQARVALSGKSEVETKDAEAPANSVHMGAGCAGRGARGRGAARLIGAGWARALPLPPPAAPPRPCAIWPLRAVQVSAECITLCVIDDCLDSDVPLLEVSLGELQVEQDLRKVEEAFEDPILVSTPAGGPGSSVPRKAGAGGGRLAGVLSADYYNRTLSGWEPFVEPWRFETTWEYTLTSGLSLGRVQTEVTSQEVLNTNVTSSLIELCQLVRNNWTADYYAPQSNPADQSPKSSPAGHRRRSPFVPYALRNHTGHRLWFTTLLTTSGQQQESSQRSAPDDTWVMVRADETEPFSFGARRGRARARRAQPGGHTHALAHAHAPAPLHQLALRLDGWTPPDPVCVDRVGVFFRHLTHLKTGSEARIVLEVSLEGSARKLVTVRSALQIVNKLPHPVELRVDHKPHNERDSSPLQPARWPAARLRDLCAALQRARACRAAMLAPPSHLHDHHIFLNSAHWSAGGMTGTARSSIVGAGAQWAAPLSAGVGALWARPVLAHAAPCAPAPLHWRRDLALLHAECRALPHCVYRFCCVVIRERFPPDRGPPIPGHTLTLVPALRLENLLPLELQFRATTLDDTSTSLATGTVAPAATWPFHEVNVEEGVEISVKLEGFGWSSALSVGGAGAAHSFTARLKLRDLRARRLYLNARVTIKQTDGIKVSISAAYWLVNRTGLPLVFRAEGGATEAAGQFDEHEVARMVAPLLFSFAEADGGPTLAARLGRSLAPSPEWCSPFGLGPGVGVKKLEARGGGGGGGGAAAAGTERVYAVGVWVRAGRGRYRRTNIVTFTPRYQLHNNTNHHLQFAQKCLATTLNDPGALATHVSAVSGCYLPWHWPRWEREHQLCVRVLAPPSPSVAPAPTTAWSGGFRIDSARTLHIACREVGGSAYEFVRVEVVAQGSALLVVLSDAACAPAPLRIDNYSPVAIMFHQVGCSEECVVGAHASSRWALPEPEGAAAVALRAPGGPRTALPLDLLPSNHHLVYQNFLYIVFTATQSRDGIVVSASKQGEEEGGLVLEVPLNSTRIVLGRKRYGDRSQLWRRGPNEQLIHEGSSPPQPTDALLSDDTALSAHAMVLDIEDSAPRPTRASALVLRRADPRRASTQAWRLVPPGRMACAHSNLCVQPHGGLMALTVGSRVVLGLPECRAGAGAGAELPAEQAVGWHTLRPGSGRLDVALSADGPTRVLRITDHKAPESGWIEGESSEEEQQKPVAGAWSEWGVRVSLAGLSVSVVARAPTPAELVHARVAGLLLELAAGPRAARLALALQHMQWDNQLLGTPSPVLLYCLPERGAGAGAGSLPALHAAAELMRTPARRYNAYFFRHFIVALRPLAIRLEERLILKLWAWAAPPDEETAPEQPDEADFEARRVLDELTALHAARCYIALIKLIPSQIRLSMCTANKLEPELAALKRRLGLTLIKFEDACVELEPFVRAHPFDTPACLARQMLKHFKDELKWQAAKILGSVDFLGNPLGFVADVSEGVTGFFLEGNVSALLKNVTHGISNSAAKVTESLGDGLERVVGDEAHEETRRRIRSAAPGAHLAAGFRGLGLGILGGMTSLVKHSYEGAAQEGLPGFLAGVGKGLVGTVTKPVIGVLDLAAETASALRDTSRRSDKWVPGRVRAPRVAGTSGTLLARYCAQHAAAAALLHALNGHDYTEHFLAYRIVRDTPHDIRALLSATYLRIFTCKHTAPQVVMETHLSNLVSCSAVSSEGAHFVELVVRGGGGGAGAEGVRRPRVQCDSAELAAWVAEHAAYARQLHYEQLHTLLPTATADL